MKLRLTILAVTIYCLFSVNTCMSALLEDEAKYTSIARTWLGKPDWVADECDECSLVCECGKKLLYVEITNSTDTLSIDRSSGQVFGWFSKEDDDERVDAHVADKAFKAWAPSHVPASLMSHLRRISPVLWVYHQPNGIEHDGSYVYLSVNPNGKVTGCVIRDCSIPDYTGAIPITPKKALEIAGNWVRKAHDTTKYKLTWSRGGPILGYGYTDKTLAYPVPSYTIECDLPASLNRCGCESNFGIKVNAVTGEVWNESDYALNGSHLGNARAYMLIVTYGKTATRGYSNGLIPLKRLAAFANRQKLSAKARDKAFTVDGKRVALPSKVVSKDGILYLPWQALKYLKGVKASYNPKTHFLQVTPPVKL